MKSLEKVNEVLRTIGKYMSGFAILAMMLIIVADVFMRNVFETPLAGTYEIVQYFLMPLAVFPALGYAYWSGVLPRLSELISKAPPWFEKFNRILILIIDAIVFGMLTYFGFIFAIFGMQDKMAIPMAGTLIPIWPIYFLVPIGFLFVLLEVLLRFVRKPEEGGEIGL